MNESRKWFRLLWQHVAGSWFHKHGEAEKAFREMLRTLYEPRPRFDKHVTVLGDYGEELSHHNEITLAHELSLSRSVNTFQRPREP